MRIFKTLTLTFGLFFCTSQENETTYDLIKTEMVFIKEIEKKLPTPVIQESVVENLPERLKAIAALYSSFSGSNCDNGFCDLTTSLKLGRQGSVDHKNLIIKWFPNYKIAQERVNNNCFIASNTSSIFNEFDNLSFMVKRDTVKVKYSVNYYNHGKSKSKKGVDIFILKPTEIVTISQSLWGS